MKGSLKLVIFQLIYLKKEIEEKQKKLKRSIKIAAEIYEVEELTIHDLMQRDSK